MENNMAVIKFSPFFFQILWHRIDTESIFCNTCICQYFVSVGSILICVGGNIMCVGENIVGVLFGQIFMSVIFMSVVVIFMRVGGNMCVAENLMCVG